MAKRPAARITKSLDALRSQVNTLAPKRSKASDGWLGDAKHSMRKSDHNPEPDGTVDALDITHDPKNGVDIQKVCDAIIASKDRRVSYLICNGKIIAGNGGPRPWVKRNYTGANKHTKHLHVSVLDKFQDDTTPWKIEAAFGKAAPVPAKPATKKAPSVVAAEKLSAQLAAGATPIAQPAEAPAVDKETIERVQQQLKDLGYTEVGGVDGKIGTMTATAIRAFRAENGLPEGDGIDDALLLALQKAKPRVLAPARSEAPPEIVREKVPEVRTNWLTKVGAFFTGIFALIGSFFDGILGNLDEASGVMQPVKDAAGDVPGWMWMLAIAVVAGGLFLIARHGEAKGVEAFKTGARR
ncbi:MAG: peptidoglycan-binding protein [Mesorhizobium sp.]|uniref:peptidoglycan-binding domain-containing protein n=1 Tax=Mesorhizobium sp. TaxID=1871066 RepID=UPI000FE62A7E|nr:peptidoglycan-binding protein [Mesorhizobium sp.]RWQ56577.1 MAG: peptidoglycan-binding protein [Mesorhizobium sp.]